MMERIDQPMTGAWQLLLFKVEGLKNFKLDQDHFVLSWFAVPLSAPFFLLSLLATNNLLRIAGEAPTPLWLGLLKFLIVWVVTAGLVVGAFMLVGRGKAALPAVLIYNWLQLVVGVAVTPAFVIAGFELVPRMLVSPLLLACVLFAVVCKGHLLWRLLGPLWLPIMAITGGEIAVSLLVDRLFG